MDWFGTTIEKNLFADGNVTELPSHIIELWQCKKCLNIIYYKKNIYSCFDLEYHSKTVFSLENVVIQFSRSGQQLFVQIRLKNKSSHLVDQIHVFCKTCPDKTLLAQMVPQLDIIKHQFSYQLLPQAGSIEKTKITMGKTNFSNLAAAESNINSKKLGFPISVSSQLKEVKNNIQNQIMLWYQSKNFRIHQAFGVYSERKRRQLDDLKNFLLQMNPNLLRQEQSYKKILKNKQKTSNQLLSDNSLSYGIE